MQYCFIQNNVISIPTSLPASYNNISGFHHLDEITLNSYGFYKFEDTNKPSFNSYTHFITTEFIFNNSKVYSNYITVPHSEESLSHMYNNRKNSLLSSVNNYRDYQLDNGFSYSLQNIVYTFQTRESDRIVWESVRSLCRDLIATNNANAIINLRTQDNQNLEVTAQNTFNMLLDMNIHFQDIYEKAWSIKDYIRSNVNSSADVDNYNIEQNWS